VKLEGGFVIDAYPVDLQVGDFFIVSITVLLMGAIASYYPLKYLLKRNLNYFRFE
jgi:lipoprotein-releasing system permease protein